MSVNGGRIGIVGCGIAGLAAGLVLARAGAAVTLFERAPHPRPVGAGLLLQPTGLYALECFGLLEGALAAGTPITRLVGRSTTGARVLDLRYADGGEGTYGLGIHRGALFALLLDAALAAGCEIKAGAPIRAIEEPARPQLGEASGARHGPFDLVLLADGAASALRAQLWGEGSARPYRWGALYGVLPQGGGLAADELAQVYRGTRAMLGVLPMGRGPLGVPEASLFVSVRTQAFAAMLARPREALLAELLALWPDLAGMLEHFSGPEAFTPARYFDVRLADPRRGRVLALGDAAHGTSPQLGQGANLALLDALELGAALGPGTRIEDGLERYVRRRAPQIAAYRLASRWLTPFFQSEGTLGGALRDRLLPILSALPPTAALMRWILCGRARLPWGVWRPPEGSPPGLEALQARLGAARERAPLSPW